MRAPYSMTKRMIVTLTGCLTVLWVTAAIVGAIVANNELNEELDAALEEVAQRLLPLAVDDLYRRRQRDDEDARALPEATVAAHYEWYLTYQLRDGDGRVLLRSHDATQEPFDAPLVKGFWENSNYRIYTEPSIGSTIFMQVAEPLSHRSEAIEDTVGGLLIPLLGLIPLGALAIWYVTHRGLSSIGELRKRISIRDSTNLDHISAEDMPIELVPVVSAVNDLLTRLHNALDAEKLLAANSAHELRTPLSAALAQTQRLVAELGDGEPRNRAREVEAALQALARMFSKLMQLSRADAGLGLAAHEIDLLPVLRAVMGELSAHACGTKRIEFDEAHCANLMCKIDIDAFGIAMRNLIENAIIHSPPGTQVRVFIDANGAIHVVNSGTVIPPERLGRLRNRFERGPTSAKGSGLGLAIVDRIAGQVGGTLELLSPATGMAEGFEAVIAFRVQVRGI